MRGSALHNRYRGEPTGLPSDLNHTALLRGERRVLTSKRHDRQYVLSGATQAYYDGLDIGTMAGNAAANELVRALDQGITQPAGVSDPSEVEVVQL